MTVVSTNTYAIEKMIYFGDFDIREYSNTEYESAMKRIKCDHERKDKYDSTLSKITQADTMLNVRLTALFRLKKHDCDVLFIFLLISVAGLF
jgi:hypothetical protein